MRIRTRECKTALNRTGIPGGDYCLNPYLGCTHNCLYCYASFMLRYHPSDEPWGSFVEAKINLPVVLKKEAKRTGKVLLGTVCDPYQPAEAIFYLTRKSLLILGEAGYQVEVMTKSDLILRDIEILKRFASFSVEFSITTLDEKVAKLFEPAAPSPARRLNAISRLIEAEIPTTVFFGPVLPGFSDSLMTMVEILETLKGIGVKYLLIDKMNYLSEKLDRIAPVLDSEKRQLYRLIATHPLRYIEELRAQAEQAIQKTGINGKIIF